MKKRRELDALVNGKLGRRKVQKNGQHELLRNDTDSSDVEEFAIPPKTIVRKRSAGRFCSTCLAMCGFFLLVACVVAVGGLVWVHIELKKDVDHLRTQLRKVESGTQGNPEEFQQLRAQLQDFKEELQHLKTNTQNIQKQQNSTNAQIKSLNSTTKSLSDSVALHPKLINLPEKLQELSGDIATIGSDLTSLKQDMSKLAEFKTQIEVQVGTLQDRVTAISAAPAVTDQATPPPPSLPSADLTYIYGELEKLKASIEIVNATLTQKLTIVKAQSQINHVTLDKLFNKTDELDTQLTLMDLRPMTAPSVDVDNMHDLIEQAVSNAVGGAMNLTEGVSAMQVQDMHEQIHNLSLTISAVTQRQKQSVSNTSDEEQLRELSNKVDQNQADIQLQLNNLNSTILSVQERVTKLEPMVDSHHDQIHQSEGNPEDVTKSTEDAENKGKDDLPLNSIGLPEGTTSATLTSSVAWSPTTNMVVEDPAKANNGEETKKRIIGVPEPEESVPPEEEPSHRRSADEDEVQELLNKMKANEQEES